MHTFLYRHESEGAAAEALLFDAGSSIKAYSYFKQQYTGQYIHRIEVIDMMV